MSIENLLAQGYQSNIEPYGNALMRAQEFKAKQQANALMQMQAQDMHAQRALALQQAQQAAEQQRLKDAEFGRIQAGGQLDPVALLRMNVPKDQIEFLANRGNLGRPEVAREAERAGANGRPEKVFFDKFGNPVGQALPQAVKLSLENLGGSSVAVDPYALKPGQTMQRTMTPEGRDASARGWAGLKQADAHFQVSQAQGGKPPAGYRWKPDGTMEAIPGGPADTKLGGPGARVQDAKDVLEMLDLAEPLIAKSTGSYAGTGVDMAARAVGASTPGAQAAAELKALEGALISKMPKMSGPQSDKDVMLYRQMAGQIGDSTIPPETKKAAIRTIRQLNERYAGQAAKPAGGPQPGAVVDGYRFKGGNPADKANWEKQ